MEQSSSRLYSGPLSQAAQKILAVLRAQNPLASRRNTSYYNHRQMERYYGSQRESLAQSSWSMSQEESRNRNTDRPLVSSFSTSDHDSSNQWQSCQTSACYQSLQTPSCSLSSQASSCWDPSLQRQSAQTEAYYQCSQIYSQRKCSKPPTYQSNQAPFLTQHEVTEKTAVSFSHIDRYTLSTQTPERLFEHQATPWRNSTEEIRPSFIHILSPDDGVFDEVLFPTMEHPNTHEEEPSLAYHPVSSCLKLSEETDDNTPGAQKEKKVTESWNIPRNELEDTVCIDSQTKWKLPPSYPTEEAISGGEDRGTLCQQPESETLKAGIINLLPSDCVTAQETCCNACSLKPMRNLVGEEGVDLIVDSERMTEAGTGQMSNTEHEMQDGVNGVMWKERGHVDSALLDETGSIRDMGGIQLLGTSKNSSLEKNFNLLFTTNMDKIFDCDNEGEKLGERGENYFEYRVNTPESKEVEHPPGSVSKEMSVGCHAGSPIKISLALERRDNRVSLCQAKNPQDRKHHTENSLVQCETKLVQGDNTADNLEGTTDERIDVMEVRLQVEPENRTKAGTDTSTEDKMETELNLCSDIQREKTSETDDREVSELPERETESGERGRDNDESVMPPVHSDECTSTEDTGRESGSKPILSQECRAKRSGFRAPCLHGNHQHHVNTQAKATVCTAATHQKTANGSIRGSSSSVVLAQASTFAAGQNSSSVQDLTSTDIKPSKKVENSKLPTSQNVSHHPPLIPSFPLKRKHEVFQHQNPHPPPPPKIYLTRRPPKWEPPRYSQEKAGEGVNEFKRARSKTVLPDPSDVAPEPPRKVSRSHETGIVLEVHKDPFAPEQTRQICQSKVQERSRKSSVTCKPVKHKQAKCVPDRGTNGPKVLNEGPNGGEPQNQSKAGCLTAVLTSDIRVKDSEKMNPDEKMRMLEKARQAKALVLTLVYRDGTTQLDPEQKLTPPVCGLLVLMKNNLDCSTPEDSLGPNDCLVYLKLEQTPAWAQQHKNQELFTRDMLLQVISRTQLVVCYKAKDLLRTTLQFYRRDLNWKQVAGCHIQDPQVSGWLLDPANPSSCYQDLLNKHCKRPCKTPALGTKKVSQVISGLYSLHWLNMELCYKLQSHGLWGLYSDMELNMISVLAAMESHCIHVDKEALKRTSDLLGTKMKQLEQEAHRAAGQIFLVTSNTQLRTLLQLQDLHPLPKIILEYRQVHKIKSTFVDRILSCMMSKSYISPTWYQTSVVTGRISAKNPNFQALPRQPLQITKKQYIQGKEEEVVSVHPRAMFIPQEGWTFLAADFCQVELRLLAHLSSDPELLRIFTHPQADVFTMLASQWKGVSEGEVTPEDREHAKRIVYSVVYGAGRERLSGILGVSAEQASRFQDSFLQTYREVQVFIQRTIQQCHKQGYVLSIMGRRRTLPNIHSPDWGIRMQAERQAVNFVVQGSAADLCKMAMIRIFNLVSSSSSLSARLIAQLHDELLYEVEDSQVEQFAALVRSTMESLQHIDHQGVHLKVPLKVAVSSGKSWGSMSELNIPPMPPSSSF
uniref:Polymerase (DNA directed) nu n=1 Tax=Dicentrarchus labrax TaxID=13489 RepID=A0A8P4KTA6_DICLA